MSLFAPLLAAGFLLAIQGPLLQLACTFVGERPPRYRDALLTAFLAAIVATLFTVAWSCSLGLLVGLVSRTLAWVLSVFVGLGVTASVYRARLGLTGAQAFAVTLAHHAMTWAISALLYGLLAWLR